MFVKIILLIAIAIACFFVNKSQAWKGKTVYQNDSHPGKCYVNENLILTPGQSAKSPQGCFLIDCNSSSGNAVLKGCLKEGAPPNCSWEGYENAKADFPICCVEKFVCDNPADEAKAKKLQDKIRKFLKQQGRKVVNNKR